MTTIKNAALLLLSVGGALLLPLKSAHADERICVGPWQSTHQGAEWGGESKCECSLNGKYVRGGVFAAKTSWGYLWSQGTGRVTAVTELYHWTYSLTPSYRANGKTFSAENGAGLEEVMMMPSDIDPGTRWTGRYRSECHVRD